MTLLAMSKWSNTPIETRFRQIIAGARDAAVPPVNAEFLAERLPNGKLDILDAGHFTWEDAADEYAALVTNWWSGGSTTVGPAAASIE
jgi:predicted alpha/beta hydrolase family esterase